MDKSNNRTFVLWFFVGCAVLAPTYIYSTSSNEWFRLPPKPIGDGLCYESIGFSLSQGNGFRENYADPLWQSEYRSLPEYEDFLYRTGNRDIAGTSRPPLFPVIIAGVYLVFGRGTIGYLTVRLISAIYLTLAGAMATGLTAQLLCNRTPRQWVIMLGALVTLLLAASQRTLKDYTSDFLTEPLALLLAELLFVFVILKCENSTHLTKPDSSSDCTRPTSWIWGVSIGLIVGMMILSRSLFVFWIPGLLLLWLFTLPDAIQSRLRIVFIISITVSTVCAPWWIHNCWALKRFMPLGTQGPIALLGGYCQEAYDDGGNWNHTPENLLRARLAGSREFREAKNDTERELLVVEAARLEVNGWIANNIRSLPMLAVKRAVTHWNPYWGRAAIWKVLILLGLFWAVFQAGTTRYWLVGMPLLSTLVVMLLYETGGRFLVPVYGLLYTLGGLGISGWWARRPN